MSTYIKTPWVIKKFGCTLRELVNGTDLDFTEACSGLTGRQKSIITSRLLGRTLREAGSLFGITKERTRQIEVEALEIIHTSLGDQKGNHTHAHAAHK